MNKLYCILIFILTFLSCTTNDFSYSSKSLSVCMDSTFYLDSCNDGHHVIKYKLPSKYIKYKDFLTCQEAYIKKNGNIYGDTDLRFATAAYVADSKKLNFFSFESWPFEKLPDLDFFEHNFVNAFPCYEYYYDIKREKLSNGDEKKVFVCIFPNRLWRQNKKLCIETLIHCTIATTDHWQYSFLIKNQDFPEQFDFNEKMEILNSIVVE